MRDLGHHKERLEKLSELDDNWDSYGARAIKKEAVTTAGFILESLPDSESQFDELGVFPTGGGGILLSWQRSGRDLEVEILDDKNLLFSLFDETDGVIVEDEPLSSTDKNEIVERTRYYLEFFKGN